MLSILLDMYIASFLVSKYGDKQQQVLMHRDVLHVIYFFFIFYNHY